MDAVKQGRLLPRRPTPAPADWFGLGASGLCLVHCALMPFLVLLLPALAVTDAFMHPVLAALALLATLWWWRSRPQHDHSGRLLWMCFVPGNLLILAAAFVLHELEPHGWAIGTNTLGSLFLVTGHLRSRMLPTHEPKETHCTDPIC